MKINCFFLAPLRLNFQFHPCPHWPPPRGYHKSRSGNKQRFLFSFVLVLQRIKSEVYYIQQELEVKQGTRRKKPPKECGGTFSTEILHLQTYSASPTNDAIIKRKYNLWFHESISVAPLQSILKKMNQPWYLQGDGQWGMLGLYIYICIGFGYCHGGVGQ